MIKIILSSLFLISSIICSGQTFEPKRDLIETETSREGLLFLGLEFRYFSLHTKDFAFTSGSDLGSYQERGFAFGGHAEYFLDRKEVVPFSLIISALYQQTDIVGDDGVDFAEIQSSLITSQSINTELSLAYFILGSDLSVTAGIGAGFSLGLSTENEDNMEALENVDAGTSVYVPLSVRYNYQLFSIDGFVGFFYNPYIVPMLENTESQSSYGFTISVRNPFQIYY